MTQAHIDSDTRFVERLLQEFAACNYQRGRENNVRIVGIILSAALIGTTSVVAASEKTNFGQLQLEQVDEHVWSMRQPDRLWANVIGNVTIVEQADGYVIFDAGGSYANGAHIADTIASLGDKPVKAIVISHWHNDHSLGAGAIRDRWPNTRIIASKQTRDELESIFGSLPRAAPQPRSTRSLNGLMAYVIETEAKAYDAALDPILREHYAIEADYLRKKLSEPYSVTLALPTEIVRDSLVLDDPHAPIELRYLGRSNTEGDIIAWLPYQGTLLTGDAVVGPTPYGFGSFPTEWIGVLEELRSFDAKTIVPGHGNLQQDDNYIILLQESLREVIRQVDPLAEQGLDLEAVQDRVDYSGLTRKFAGNDPWRRLWLQNYFLKPITESAWREATGATTEQQMVD